MTKLHKKLINIAYKRCSFDNGRTFHISYIIKRNKILSIGINDESKTSTISKGFGAPTESLHSEMDAFIRFISKYGIESNKKCSELNIYNVRIDRLLRIRISKPCAACQRLLDKMNFRRIYWTDNNGIFQGGNNGIYLQSASNSSSKGIWKTVSAQA